jgi:hypothetical protein
LFSFTSDDIVPGDKHLCLFQCRAGSEHPIYSRGATGQTVNPMISNPSVLNPEFSPVFPSSPETPPAGAPAKPEGTKATDEGKSLGGGSKTGESGKEHVPVGGETK